MKKYLVISSIIIAAIAGIFLLRSNPKLGGSGFFDKGSFGDNIISPVGLVGYWRFDDGSGSSAIDSSGNGHTATLTGSPSWVAGKVNDAISLGGSGQYATLPNSMFNTQSGTISMWFNLTSYPASSKRGYLWVSTLNGDSPELRLFIDGNSHDLTFAGYSSSAYQFVINKTVPAPGSGWHHLTGTWKDNDARLYIDDVLVGSDSSTAITGSTSNYDYFGKYPLDGTDNGLDGIIDEARLYSRAISSDEITTLYNSTKENYNVAGKNTLNTGLVGSWSFDGQDLNSTTAYDRSGQGNNGTLTNGPKPVQGKIGQALSFNGSNQYVDSGNNAVYAFAKTDSFTLDAWIKTNQSGAHDAISGKYFDNGAGTTLGYFMSSLNGNLLLQLQSSATDYIYKYGSINIADNKWHHVLVTYDGSSSFSGIKLYVDSVQDTSVTTGASGSLSSLSNSSGFIVGKRDSITPLYFTGSIDQVHIYNRILTPSEITQLYNQNKLVVQAKDNLGLVGAWKFDEGAGTIANDSSGHNNVGTLQDSPSWIGGKFGKALSFNATNNQAVITPLINFGIGQSMTISSWIKPNTTGSGYDMVVSEGWGVANTNLAAYYLGSNGGGSNDLAFYIATHNGGTYHIIGVETSSHPLTVGVWNHVAVVYNTATPDIKFYVNDVFVSSSVVYQNPGGSTIADLVGGKIDVNGGYFNIGQYDTSRTFPSLDGSLDDVRIYGRALSSTEISSLYASSSYAQLNSSQNSKLATGLMGQWSYDGKDISGTTAYDTSGNGNDATLVNTPSRVEGTMGQALNFNGSNQYMTASPSPIITSGGITTSAWIRSTSLSSGTHFIVGKRAFNGTYDSANYNLYVQSNNLRFFYTALPLTGEFYEVWTAGTSATSLGLNDGKWHLVTFTHVFGNSTNAHMYVDGVEVSGSWTTNLGSYAMPVTSNDTTQNFAIGANYYTSYGDNFSGDIDDVRVYNTQLSSDEIQHLYLLGR